MRTCSTCKTERSLEDFPRQRSKPLGRGYRCKPCSAEANRLYRLRHLEERRQYEATWRSTNPEKKRASASRRLLAKRGMILVAYARSRARKKGVEFALDDAATIADIQRRVDAGVCELTGTPLDLSRGRTFASPSLDRRNPALGYTPDNVRVVCHGFNMAMGEWGEDALLRMVGGYLSARPEVATQFVQAYMRALP